MESADAFAPKRMLRMRAKLIDFKLDLVASLQVPRRLHSEATFVGIPHKIR